MTDLHISVVNKIATYQKRDGDIVCGNSDYQIKFTFDDEWNAYDKKIARFIWGGQFQDVEFTGDTCPVPILSGVTLCEVGVYAGELSTTTSAFIGCKPSILCQPASPSVENDKYWANEARKYAEEAKEAAEEAASEALAELEPTLEDFRTNINSNTIRIGSLESEVYKINQKLVTADEVKAIVQEQLGVIENGTY